MTAPEYRLLQVFLADTGEVSEVSFRDNERPHIVCTCSGGDDCKHIAVVVSRLTQNGGKYPFPKVDAEKLAEASQLPPAAFREFVLTHGAVDVL
jgi:hypothetical protein